MVEQTIDGVSLLQNFVVFLQVVFKLSDKVNVDFEVIGFLETDIAVVSEQVAKVDLVLSDVRQSVQVAEMFSKHAMLFLVAFVEVFYLTYVEVFV